MIRSRQLSRRSRRTYQPLSLEPLRLIYLAGASFCGSTLLSFIMNGHPEVLSIGEAGPTRETEGEDYRCSCGDRLRECPFAAEVRSRMESQHHVPLNPVRWDLRMRYSENRYLEYLVMGASPDPLMRAARWTARAILPGYLSTLDRFARRNEAFVRAALEVAGKKFFFDATKLASRIPLLHHVCGDTLMVVHMVRDPRGYGYSAGRHENKSPAEAARSWKRTHEAIAHELSYLEPYQWVRIQYEALCRAPDSVLNQVARFAGAAAFEFQAEYRQGSHHIIGNKMRLSSDPRQSLELDERWREALCPDAQRTIASVAGPLARSYGYDI